MSHNESVSWLQWSVDLILPGLSVGLMSQYSGLLPPLNGLATIGSILIFRARWKPQLIYYGQVSCFNQRPLESCRDSPMLQPTTHLKGFNSDMIGEIKDWKWVFACLLGGRCSLEYCQWERTVLVNWLGVQFCVVARHMMQWNANYSSLFKWLRQIDINYNKCTKVPSYFWVTPVATREEGSGPTWEWQQLTCLPSCLAAGNRRDEKSDSKWWVVFRV